MTDFSKRPITFGRRRFMVGAAAVGAAGLLPAMPRRAAAQETLDELVAQARAEGGLMFYSGMDEPTSRALVDGFTQKYGIPSQLYRGGSNVTPKYQLEFENNQVLVDVVQESNIPAFRTMAAAGQLVEWVAPEAANIDPSLVTPHYAILSTIAFTWFWNTRAVSDDLAPASWEDFLKPEFQGRLGMPDSAAGATSPPAQWYYIMRDHLGLDYMQALGQQRIRFYQTFGDLSNAVASGEVIATPTMLSYYTPQLQRRGAPVADRFPDPAFVTDRPVGLAMKAPHPAAGKLFVNYCLSEEGQRVISSEFAIPVRSDIEVPEGIPLPGSFNAMRIEDWDDMLARSEEIRAEFTRLFKS